MSWKNTAGELYSAGSVAVGPSSEELPAIARPWLTTAIMPAHSGVATLVPPICSQGVLDPKSQESYTATPVAGSASAATSGTARLVVVMLVGTTPVW